jgi:hypothetical protein
VLEDILSVHLSRAASSGTFIHISRSKRPALRKAGSNESGRLVAPMISTGFPSVFSSEISISVLAAAQNTVHASQKLCDNSALHFSLCILAFGGHGVDFVNEHQTRCILSGIVEYVTDFLF